MSLDTVSRILNRNATYKKPALAERAERIRQLAAELGYRPNSAARAARSGRFQRLGLVLPHGRSSYMPYGLLSSLTHALAERDYQLAVSELPDDATEDQMPHVLRDLSVDGVLALLDFPTEAMRQKLAALRLPLCWMNAKMPTRCVHPDEVGGGRRLTNCLISRGHRRIAFVDFARPWWWAHRPSDYVDEAGAPPPRFTSYRPMPDAHAREHFSAQDRREGYRQAMSGAGLEPHACRLSAENPSESVEAVRALLQASPRPTAIIATAEREAMRIIRAIESLRLAVPRDVSVATFTWGGGVSAELGLTMMAYGAARLSEAATRIVMRQIEDGDTEAPATTIDGTLLINQEEPVLR